MTHSDIIAAFKAESEPGYILARRLRQPAAKVRRALIQMETEGLVKRCPRYSFVNSVSWRLVPSDQPCPAP